MLIFLKTHLVETVVLVLGVLIFIQLLYYVLLFFKFALHKPKRSLLQQNLGVSVVISAKNEAHNLIHTLPVIASQNYPLFEVIVVNDHSNDGTKEVIEDCIARFPHIKMVELNSSVTNVIGKKFPLSIGIKTAMYNHLLLTDADCMPASENWLQLMAAHFNREKQIIIGYNRIQQRKNWMNKLIRYELVHYAIQFFSYHLIKIPMMGVGKNLAYTKELFIENKGFTSHYHIPYGEDTLFINRVATSKNCDIEYSYESQTISKDPSTVRTWFRLKKNRNKSISHFATKHRWLLGVYQTVSVLIYPIWILLVLLIPWDLQIHIILFSMLLIKLIFQHIAFGMGAKKLNEKGIVPFLILFDLISTIANPVIYILSSFNKKS